MLKNTRMTLFILAVATLGVSGCDKGEQQPLQSDIARSVKMLTVGVNQTTDISKFPAVISDTRLVEMSFTRGGKLIDIPVHEAQSIKQGEVIARLDQRELKNSLKKAQAQYQSAQSEYKRALQLSKTKAISKSALQQKLTERDISRSQFDSAQQALTDSVLVAPFDGFIAQALVDEGQIVSGGQTIVVFISGDALEASIDIPASYLANMYTKAHAENEAQTYVVLDIAPHRRLAARYKKATLLADASTQTYKVTFEFVAPNDLLVLPGMNASIEILAKAESAGDKLSVPISAVSSDGSQTFVWVVNQDDMSVSKREISLEEGIGESVYVLSGLKSDEIIVSAGGAYLHEGMKVREWK